MATCSHIRMQEYFHKNSDTEIGIRIVKSHNTFIGYDP